MTATTMDRAVRAVAAKQYGVFALRQVHHLGVTDRVARRRARREEWEVVGCGVYRVAGALPSWRQDLQIALLIVGPGSAVSHRAAAALARVPGFSEGPIEILAPHGTTHHRLERGAVHESRRMPTDHITLIDGLPVTTLARTLCDLATLAPAPMHPQRLERAIDNALAMRLTTCEQLWKVWGDLAARGRDGVRLMRSFLAERLPGYVAPASELEAIFRDVAKFAGFEEPVRQLDVGGEAWVGRADFVFRRHKVIVEVDGRLGHASKLDSERDERRDKALEAAGWRVLRFTWEDLVTRRAWVIAQLRKELVALAA